MFATPHQYVLCMLVPSVAPSVGVEMPLTFVYFCVMGKTRPGYLSQAIDGMRKFNAVSTIGAVTPPEK